MGLLGLVSFILRGFLHYEQIIEPSKEEVTFLGSFSVVSHLQCFVVADDRDNVYRFKELAHDREEFESDGEEAFCFFMRVAYIQAHVFPRFQDTINLADDLLHRLVIFILSGVEFSDTSRVVTVVDMRGVGRVDEYKVGFFVFERELAGIDTEDILAGGINIVAQCPAAEVAGDIQGCSASAHRVYYQVARLGVPLQKVPDNVTWGGSAVIGITLKLVTVMLGGILPKRANFES